MGENLSLTENSTIYNLTDLNFTIGNFTDLEFFENSYMISDILTVMSQTICVIGLILNILSIIAFAHTPKDFMIKSKLIISLSVSDTLILVAVLLHQIIVDNVTVIPSCLNLFKTILTHTSYLATLLNLAMMALDTYVYTTHVYVYERFVTNFKTNCMVMLVWMVSIIIPLSEVFVGSAILDTEEHNSTVFCKAIEMDDFKTDFFITHFIFIVIIIMTIAYINIGITGKRMQKMDILLRRNTSIKNKTIVTTGLFILTFMFFWVPYGAFHLFITYKMMSDPYYSDDLENIYKALLANHFLTNIFLLNSIADPLIYALRLKKVRKGYRLFFQNVITLCLPSSVMGRINSKRAFTSERRKTISTTISGQDWFDEKLPNEELHTIMNSQGHEAHCDVTTMESELTLEPLDSRTGSPNRNTSSTSVNET